MHVLALVGLCAITALAYSNSFRSGFVLDNSFLLTEDRIQSATWENLRLIWNHTYWWPAGESGLYRPFTALTFLCNYALLGNGDTPSGYHWTNLLIHLANVLLAFAVARRILGQFRLPFYCATLWALHPVLTESVTNIVGRADLLAGMSLLGGFLLYLKSTEATGWRKWAWLAGLIATTAFGVFSKESAVTIAAVIVLYEAVWWSERKQLQGALTGLGAVALPIGVMLFQRAAVLKASQPALFPFVDNPLTGAGFWAARLTAMKIIAKYVALILWPATLSCDYSYPQIPLASGTLMDWLAWISLAALFLGAALTYRWNRAIFFFFLVACVTLLPSSNLIILIGTVMAERLLYVPSLALIICLVLILDWLMRRAGVGLFAPMVFCLIAAAFGVRTWVRNLDWLNQTTLAEAAVRASPKSFKVYGMLAGALDQSGTGDSNLDRAISVSEQGVLLLDSLPDSRNSWRSYTQTAGYYQKKGDLLNQKRWDGTKAPESESRQAWQRAVDLLLRSIAIIHAEPKTVAPKGVFITASSLSDQYRALSIAYSRLGEAEESYAAALQAREADPMSTRTYIRISAALVDLKRHREAALALMEGHALTGDGTLDEGLVAIYRGDPQLDPTGCAVVKDLGVLSRQPSCDAMRVLRCAAAENASRRALAIGRKVRAKRIIEASAAWQCSRG